MGNSVARTRTEAVATQVAFQTGTVVPQLRSPIIKKYSRSKVVVSLITIRALVHFKYLVVPRLVTDLIF